MTSWFNAPEILMDCIEISELQCSFFTTWTKWNVEGAFGICQYSEGQVNQEMYSDSEPEDHHSSIIEDHVAVEAPMKHPETEILQQDLENKDSFYLEYSTFAKSMCVYSKHKVCSKIYSDSNFCINFKRSE